VASGRGRSSVRLSSKATFSDGLVIADLSHMPEGCGTFSYFLNYLLFIYCYLFNSYSIYLI